MQQHLPVRFGNRGSGPGLSGRGRKSFPKGQSGCDDSGCPDQAVFGHIHEDESLVLTGRGGSEPLASAADSSRKPAPKVSAGQLAEIAESCLASACSACPGLAGCALAISETAKIDPERYGESVDSGQQTPVAGADESWEYTPWASDTSKWEQPLLLDSHTSRGSSGGSLLIWSEELNLNPTTSPHALLGR